MQPVISETDHTVLGQLIVKQKNHETKFLQVLLKRLKIIKEKDISKKTIRLNSIVVFWNYFLKKIIRLRIVSPGNENLKKRHISVLSPISMALMGYKEKDNLTVSVPGVEKKLRILRVINE
jgi:regulator of nucleoside diphosphate kinase